MTNREFSRRVNVQIVKDEPLSRDEWLAVNIVPGPDFIRNMEDHAAYLAGIADAYQQYLDRFQAFRWRAVAANNEPIAHGESYFNEADCVNAVNLLAGDDTTVYVMPMYGEDRGEKLLRFGVTDRKSQEPPF